MTETCHCCSAEPPMSGAGTLGKNCFMLWYDAGLTNAAKLRKESLWRRKNEHWPWGKSMPTVAALDALHFEEYKGGEEE